MSYFIIISRLPLYHYLHWTYSRVHKPYRYRLVSTSAIIDYRLELLHRLVSRLAVLIYYLHILSVAGSNWLARPHLIIFGLALELSRSPRPVCSIFSSTDGVEGVAAAVAFRFERERGSGRVGGGKWNLGLGLGFGCRYLCRLGSIWTIHSIGRLRLLPLGPSDYWASK